LFFSSFLFYQTAKDSRFKVNDQFSSKLRKVRIPAHSAKVETESERTVTREKVEEDRRNTIEAAIVRIMKARKTMSLQELTAEVIDQLKSRFIPEPSVIRKRVDALVERLFLQTKDQRYASFTLLYPCLSYLIYYLIY